MENTRIPDNRGQVRTVTKGGKTTIHATLAARGAHSDSLGHVFNLPTRVGDVEWLDGDTARYALRTHAAPHELVGHVTIRRVPEGGLFRARRGHAATPHWHRHGR